MAQANVDQTNRPSTKESASEAAKWSHGTFYWNELMTRDVEGAKRFYESTIGWHFEAMPMGGETYWIAKMRDTMVGGIFDLCGPEYGSLQEQWVAYLAVDNIDQRVEKALEAGAKLMKPVFDVPCVGRIALLIEPGGAIIGWMTPSS